MWKLRLLTWNPVHPLKRTTHELQWQHQSTGLALTHLTHPVGWRQTHNWYHTAPGHNPSPAGPKFGASTQWEGAERERERERDTLSARPGYTYASIYSWIHSARRVNSAEFGLILPHPFLHWFLLFFPFHCISLLYVSFSYPGTNTTHVHWSSLRRNSLQETGQSQGQGMHNSAHTVLDIQCNATIITAPVIHSLLLFDNTRYKHDVSFSILAAARDHISLNNTLRPYSELPSWGSGSTATNVKTLYFGDVSPCSL